MSVKQSSSSLVSHRPCRIVVLVDAKNEDVTPQNYSSCFRSSSSIRLPIRLEGDRCDPRSFGRVEKAWPCRRQGLSSLRVRSRRFVGFMFRSEVMRLNWWPATVVSSRLPFQGAVAGLPRWRMQSHHAGSPEDGRGIPEEQKRTRSSNLLA